MVEWNKEDVENFLYQSNAIEGEWDEDSLEDAWVAWKFLSKQIKMTPDVVRKTHRLLMAYKPIDKKYIGSYRDCPVYIGGRVALPHTLIENLVMEWCDRMNEFEREHDEDELHVLYEYIHPFIDGNGRTGRLFYNWLRLQRGEPIHIFWEDQKHEYYKLFK
jgi:Fic family protein